MLSGFLCGLSACMLWGFVYLVPLALPEYDPMLIATGRYASFLIVAAPLVWYGWREFRAYTVADWWFVTKLSLVGNITYYWMLSVCIQKSGAPLAGLCMACIPVLVAIISNIRDSRAGNGRAVSMKALIPGLVLIMLGMICANWTEFDYIVNASRHAPSDFWIGVVFGVIALLLWTWYPIRNADWLLAHPERSASAWSTAQGLVSVPFSLVFYGIVWQTSFPDMPLLGEAPLRFVLLLTVSGIICSWCGVLLWNAMSQRLPTALGGQMIVFETIFAIIYAHIYRGQWPTPHMLCGMVLLIGGVLYSLRVFNRAKVHV